MNIYLAFAAILLVPYAYDVEDFTVKTANDVDMQFSVISESQE